MIKQTSKKKKCGKSVGHAEVIKTAALESFRDAEGAALAIVDGLAPVTAPLAKGLFCILSTAMLV